MKRGDLSIVASSLNFALKTLVMRWEDTQETWDDSVRQSFEEEHMVPLQPQVLSTLKAINRLNQVMARAYEECT
jgi:hypothetical protein